MKKISTPNLKAGSHDDAQLYHIWIFKYLNSSSVNTKKEHDDHYYKKLITLLHFALHGELIQAPKSGRCMPSLIIRLQLSCTAGISDRDQNASLSSIPSSLELVLQYLLSKVLNKYIYVYYMLCQSCSILERNRRSTNPIKKNYWAGMD